MPCRERADSSFQNNPTRPELQHPAEYGMMGIIMCYYCGSPISDRHEVARTERCEECGRDLHVCLNCRFYRPGAHFDCAETIDEPVVDKDRSNFCDSFSVDPKYRGRTEGRGADRAREESARKRFSGLFND